MNRQEPYPRTSSPAAGPFALGAAIRNRLPGGVLELMRVLLEQAQKIVDLEERVALLESLATTDELTGLLNRRGFMHAFSAEMDRVLRGHSIGGVLVLIDLDQFKAINDTRGHAAGDACLRLVGKTLSQDIRHMDAVARLGGDEFAVLLGNTTVLEAGTRVQKLSNALNNLSLLWQGQEIVIGASVGVQPLRLESGAGIDDLLDRADQAMYENKRARAARIEVMGAN